MLWDPLDNNINNALVTYRDAREPDLVLAGSHINKATFYCKDRSLTYRRY